MEDTDEDKAEQHRLYIAMNTAIPVPCNYRNLLIALTSLTADLVRMLYSTAADEE